jgi:hypothetical protein
LTRYIQPIIIEYNPSALSVCNARGVFVETTLLTPGVWNAGKATSFKNCKARILNTISCIACQKIQKGNQGIDYFSVSQIKQKKH